MPNAIQRFAANTACCLATNIKKTDDKLKYGSEDMICCINKDFIANVMLNLLMCNSVASDSQWYVWTITEKLVDEAPAIYTYGTDVSVVGLYTMYSNDGQRSASFGLSGIFNWADNDELNEEVFPIIMNSFNSIGDPSIFATYEYDVDTGYTTIQLYFTEDWGTITAPPNFSGLTNALGDLFDHNVSFNEIKATDVSSGSCLTESQLCSIKDHLTSYCKTC